MPFTVIQGTFHVVGYQPDGDSIRFQALNPSNWAKLSGPPIKLNGRKHAQLRLEAIDTLETHFSNTHQPLPLALQALDELLSELGITNVVWDASHTTITQANDGVPGYILSRSVEKNQRAVAFAFAGEPPAADGEPVHLDAPLLRNSVNYGQLREGLAYPTYYNSLFYDLRAECSRAVRGARHSKLGVWACDVTNEWFEADGLKHLTEDDGYVILPKLFRRLAEFFQGGGTLEGFKEFLEAKGDALIIIPKCHFTHLDTIVEVDGVKLRMTELPESLVFMES